MKKIKSIFYLVLTVFFVVSCNSPERSIGMTTWTDDGTEYKYYLGTDEAINIVAGFNDAWQSKDFDKMKDFCADSLTLTQGDGVAIAIDNFIEELKEKDVRYSEVFSDLGSFRVAINQELASFDASIIEAKEIAFFPPMTGG